MQNHPIVTTSAFGSRSWKKLPDAMRIRSVNPAAVMYFFRDALDGRQIEADAFYVRVFLRDLDREQTGRAADIAEGAIS